MANKWATQYIEQLKAGQTIQIRPRGHSMVPRIKTNQLCTVEPVREPLKVDDVVLCEVGHHQYLHRILEIRRGGIYLIGNMQGYKNGWITAGKIYGICTKVEDV